MFQWNFRYCFDSYFKYSTICNIFHLQQFNYYITKGISTKIYVKNVSIQCDCFIKRAIMCIWVFLLLHFCSRDIFVYCVQRCKDVTNCYRATYFRYSNFPFVFIDTFLNEWNALSVWRENYFTLQNTRDAIWNWKEMKKKLFK